MFVMNKILFDLNEWKKSMFVCCYRIEKFSIDKQSNINLCIRQMIKSMDENFEKIYCLNDLIIIFEIY